MEEHLEETNGGTFGGDKWRNICLHDDDNILPTSHSSGVQFHRESGKSEVELHWILNHERYEVQQIVCL